MFSVHYTLAFAHGLRRGQIVSQFDVRCFILYFCTRAVSTTRTDEEKLKMFL